MAGEYEPTEQPYQVLLPIANAANVKQLVSLGSAITQQNDGELLLTSVATVPAQTPLSEGRRYTDEQRDVLDTAMEYVPDGIPTHRIVTVGHSVGKSIRNVATQHESDLVLLGWRGQRKRVSDYVLGSVIDDVVENAPCDVVVAKVGEIEEPTNILLPTAGGRHARLAEDIAAAVAQSTHARVTLLNVATDEDDISAGRAFLEKRRSVVANGDVDVTMNLVSGADITQTILDFATSHEFDTVVIGAAGEGIVRRVLFGDIPEEVGERFDGQALMVKAHRTIQSIIVRWLRKWISKGKAASERIRE